LFTVRYELNVLNCTLFGPSLPEKPLVVALSQRRPKFDPGRFQAEFVVHEVISRVFQFCSVNIVRSELRTHVKATLIRRAIGKTVWPLKRNGFSLISSKAQRSIVIGLFAAPLATCQGAHRPHDLHVAFKIPNVYYFITELRRQVVSSSHTNHQNENSR
jgi:hypothetical protein